MREKIKEVLKNNWKLILINLILLVVVIFTINGIVFSRNDYGDFDVIAFYKRVMLFGIFVWLAFASISIVFIKKNIKIEYYFLFFYIIFGIGYLTVFPFSTIPDEEAHFVRLYGITNGYLISEVNDEGIGGAYVNDNILDDWECKTTKLSDVRSWYGRQVSDTETFYEAANTALYSPLSYLPQALGVGLGRLMSDNVVFMLYVARIVPWVVVGILLFFAIRIIPIGKGLLFLISLMPMNMQECASFAPDGWTYGVIALFVAYILYLRYSAQKAMNKKQYILLYALLILVASCKIVYVPLCLLAFFIPKERFGNKSNYIKNAIMAAITVAIFSLGWLTISSTYLIEFNEGVDSARQVEYILHNIPSYIKLLFYNLVAQLEFYLKTFLGWKLGHFTVLSNDIMVYTTLAILISVSVKEKIVVDDKYYNALRITMVALCGLIFLIMCTSLYVQWTPVGQNIIDGVQGRYFLPFIFTFIIGCKKADKPEYIEKDIKTYSYNHLMYEMLILGYLEISALVTLYGHYIV